MSSVRRLGLFALCAGLLNGCVVRQSQIELTPNDGMQTLFSEGVTLSLFGDYEARPLGELYPTFHKKSFGFVPTKFDASGTTSIEPHFSYLVSSVHIKMAPDTIGIRRLLEDGGALGVELHELEGKDGSIVANYQFKNAALDINGYARELWVRDTINWRRFLFWTYDHQNTLKRETVRIFDSLEMKPTQID